MSRAGEGRSAGPEPPPVYGEKPTFQPAAEEPLLTRTIPVAAELGRYGDVSVHPSARVTPGVVVYRLDDRLFFANARYFKARVREAPTPTHWLVLDAEAVTHVDATGLEGSSTSC